MRPVRAVLLAAGLSSRYGENKLLEPFGDTTVVGSVARVLRESGLPTVAVTGRDADVVAQAIAPTPSVENLRFREGMGTSIACGVAACEPGESVLIVLGDMPSLRVDVVAALVAAYRAAPDDAIVLPVYSAEPGRPGHPVLFGWPYRDLLMALTGDEGARAIVHAHPEARLKVPVEGYLRDIDLRTDPG